MKRIVCICICLLAMCSMALATDTTSFSGFTQARTVIIAETTQRSAATSVMTERLQEPFRFPYYELQHWEGALTPEDLNQETLRTMSSQYAADIILVPIVKRWYWTEYHHFWYDDELIDEYSYHLSIYAYDRRSDTFREFSVSGFDRQEASVLTQPRAILDDAMDKLMRKLPYKRIPTDRVIENTSSPDWFHGKIYSHTIDGANIPSAI